MALSAMWGCLPVRRRCQEGPIQLLPVLRTSREALAVNAFESFHPTSPSTVAAYLDGWDLRANINHQGTGAQGQTPGFAQQLTLQGPLTNAAALTGVAPGVAGTAGNAAESATPTGAVALANPTQLPRHDNLPVPPEIADMIFAMLPLVDLDNARLTCRDWREYIMSSTWTLKNALDNPTCSNFQLLGHQLDSTIKARVAKDYSKSCRLRFRRLDIDFNAPNVTKCNFVSASFWPTGDLMALLVKETIQTTIEPVIVQRLLVFTLLAAEEPSYLDCIPCSKGATRIQYIRASDPDAVSISPSITGREFEIRVGQEIERFVCRGSKAFTNNGPPFSITIIRNGVFDPPATGRCKTQYDRDLKIALEQDGQWELLDDPLSDTALVSSVQYFLAKEPTSGDIHIVRIGEWPDPRAESPSRTFALHTRSSVAFIIPPKQAVTFRNVTAAISYESRKPVVKVAVSWQEVDSGRQELYIYEYGAAKRRRRNMKCKPIKGKRLSSLGFLMGGIHPKSPLWAPSSKRKFELVQALGGLRIVGKDAIRYPFLRERKWQEILVWGATDRRRTRIRLCKFDLRFSDPYHLDRPARPVPLEHDHHEQCACVLHDFAYRVTIPPRPAGFELYPHRGTVVLYDPPGRVVALEREQEGLKETIRGSMRDGMTDGGIRDLWVQAEWSKHGLVRRPDGWQGLRMEVESTGRVSEGEEEEVHVL